MSWWVHREPTPAEPARTWREVTELPPALPRPDLRYSTPPVCVTCRETVLPTEGAVGGWAHDHFHDGHRVLLMPHTGPLDQPAHD